MQSRIVFGVVGLIAGLAAGIAIGRGGAPPAVPRTTATASAPATQPGPPSDHFTRLLSVRPQADSFELLIEVANRDMDDGKFAQAIGSYERALRLREDAHAWTDLGVCYRNTGRQAEALAAKRDPALWQAEYNRAVLLADLHRVGEARALAASLRSRYPAQAEIVFIEALSTGACQLRPIWMCASTSACGPARPTSASSSTTRSREASRPSTSACASRSG